MTDGKSNGDTTSGQEGKTFPEPTPQEAYFFFNILKHQKSKPEIDWTAVAEASGFKNADVAKVRFGQVKKKLGLESGAATKSPVRGSSKKAGKAANPGDDVLGPNNSGAKVEKKTPRKRAPAKSKVQAQAQAQAQAEAEAEALSQIQNQSAAHNESAMDNVGDDMGDMSENMFSTPGYPNTEDAPVKQEPDPMHGFAMLDGGHIKQERSSMHGIHGLPAIAPFRPEGYRSSPLNYNNYTFRANEDHDV